LDLQVDEKYTTWRAATVRPQQSRLLATFKKLDQRLQKTFEKFCYKQRVIEEMALVAENIHDKIQLSVGAIEELTHQRKPAPQQHAIVQSEERKIRALEEFVRM